MTNKYQVINGTSYHAETSQEVINALETARNNRLRIRIYYGDVKTGICWNEEHDIFGYVGRSSGEIKIPLLVSNSRSYGGCALLDHCILKIRESKGRRVLYQAANFQPPIVQIFEAVENMGEYTHELFINGELYSRHKSLKSAELLKKRMS